MTVPRSTRRVYSAEELHQLRNTVSQPKLREAIEEHDGEDAELVKEHILRTSKSFAARSWRSRVSHPSVQSLRASSNKENRSTNASDNDQTTSNYTLHPAPSSAIAAPVLGEVSSNQAIRSGAYRQRTSPTPSFRRKQIESLVKAHGSPTHVRVTAGGRIVPKEQSPLCHPRFGYSAIKTNGGLIKLAQNHPIGKAQWTQATQNGFVAQDVDGKLCQIVDGTILPLTEVDGALQLFMPAPNLSITQRAPSQGAIPGPIVSNTTQQRKSSYLVPPVPSAPAQINALDLEYTKLTHELKDLDKTEVLHGRAMGKAAKDTLITKRRELVLSMDKVRKALKSLKDQASVDGLPEVPDRLQTSPPRSRLPAFLQQRQQQHRHHHQMPIGPAPAAVAYGHFVPAGPQSFAAPYGFSEPPSPQAYFESQPWLLPPPSMFVPPPPFDGSISSVALPYAQPLNTTTTSSTGCPVQAGARITVGEPETDEHLPQSDGARDLQRIASPLRSRALPIKAPEKTGASCAKSNLNPMSPAYKPGAGLLDDPEKRNHPETSAGDAGVLTQQSKTQAMTLDASSLRVIDTTDENIDPLKKSSHMASSSISSFETADFFPRNTRDYSTRKHAYPAANDCHMDIDQQAIERRDSRLQNDLTTLAHDTAAVSDRLADTSAWRGTGSRTKLPTAPPVSPASPHHLCEGHLNSTSGVDAQSLPDRTAHNISPKSKRREWLFIEEDPAHYRREASSSPEKFHACQDELCVTSSPYESNDYSNKSREWVEGYQAGLGRRAVGADKKGDFLGGYCSGLLKSKPALSRAPSTGSPVKAASRQASALPSRAVSVSQTDRRPFSGTRLVSTQPAINPSLMDSLKQAAHAPQNENAILTPAADGPHVNEPPFNLGSWAKSHAEAAAIDTSANIPGANFGSFAFPQRTSSMVQRQVHRSSEDRLGPKNEHSTTQHQQIASSNNTDTPPFSAELSGNELPPLPSSPMSCAKSLVPGSIFSVNNTNRISSMTSVDSGLYRQYLGHRVFSPHLEWKSASSVAHHAGLASGSFAHMQYDGTIEHMPIRQGSMPHAHPVPGSYQPQPQAVPPIGNGAGLYHHGRFREGSLDRLTNPPSSPPAISRTTTSPPPMSLSTSPSKSPSKHKTKESPSKSNSPARAKFEHIAEKVGIKTTAVNQPADTNSPPGKRRWRDVWRGNRKESGKDDQV